MDTINDLISEFLLQSYQHLMPELREKAIFDLRENLDSADPKSSALIECDEDIPNEEWKLANELKELCTWGEEREETLLESAEVFLKMGKLYARKATSCDGMLQKQTYIRCFALLCGAKVRFEIVENSEKVQETIWQIERCFKQLKQRSLRQPTDSISVMSIDEESPLKLSGEIRQELSRLRKETEKVLSSIQHLEESLQEDERYNLECNKIARIRCLIKKGKMGYIQIMSHIARYCLAILGPPPCKFAQVGLGSLAREEVTLYSNIEHVIILEEGVQNRDDYSDIKEYFRWFAVLFQVVIINLGETLIRSVGVKSINDLTSDDKSKNWFYDKFTPCGISFDGMVPHACKNPLGRQEPTKAKPHIVELIQPVSEMVKFLTSEEHLKNGYYLRDLLWRTCFVFGDQEVYSNFERHRSIVIEPLTKHSVLHHYVDSIGEMGERYSLTFPIVLADQTVGISRPVTVLLSLLARKFGILSSSSFDVIEELHSANIISDEGIHNLMYALSVVCEIRMKTYAKFRNQRHTVQTHIVVDLVGKQSSVDCLTILYNLQCTVDSIWSCRTTADHSELHERNLKSDYPIAELYSLMTFAYYNEAVQANENLDVDKDDSDTKVTRCLIMVTCHFFLLDSDHIDHVPLRAEQYAMKGIELLQTASPLNENCGNSEYILVFYSILAIIYCFTNRCDECIKLIHMVRSILPGTGGQIADTWRMVSVILHEEAVFENTIDTREAIKRLEEALSVEDNWMNRFILNYNLARAYMQLGNIVKTKNILMNVVKDVPAEENFGKWVPKYLYMVAYRQVICGWLDDAKKTISVFDQIPMRRGMNNTSVENMNLMRIKIDMKQENFESCFRVLEKMEENVKEICYLTISSKCIDLGKDSGRNDEERAKCLTFALKAIKQLSLPDDYAEVTNYFLRLESPFHRRKIVKALVDAPVELKDKVHYPIDIYLFKSIDESLSLDIGHFIEDLRSLRVHYPSYFLHPVTFFHSVCPCYKWLHAKGFIENERDIVINQFLEQHFFDTTDEYRAYNLALYQIVNVSIEIGVQGLWEIINTTQTRSVVKEKSIEMLFALLVNKVGMVLCETNPPTRSVIALHLPENDKYDIMYNNAVRCYKFGKRKECFQTLWNIIHTGWHSIVAYIYSEKVFVDLLIMELSTA